MEFAYMFEAIDHAPRDVLLTRMIPEVETAMAPIESCEGNESKYLDGAGKSALWDDHCLGYLLMGACWRMVAYPVRVCFVG